MRVSTHANTSALFYTLMHTYKCAHRTPTLLCPSSHTHANAYSCLCSHKHGNVTHVHTRSRKQVLIRAMYLHVQCFLRIRLINEVHEFAMRKFRKICKFVFETRIYKFVCYRFK